MEFVTLTDRSGATLIVSYKGAHTARPEDEVDVDSFVGVKSHRAKGKRITTYDVAALRFVEPELPEQPEEDEAANVEDADLMEGAEDVADVAVADDVVVDMGDAMAVVENMPDVADSYKAEPITKEDEERAVVISPEKLNLF